MMQIVYFSQKDQFLAEMEKHPGEMTFVTPSPVKADGLRSELKSTRADVVTIAKFTSDLIELLWNEDSRPQVKRKADLLLIFGILKNKYMPGLGFEQFLQAYNLFSDLRSFTLNHEALASVLEEQTPEISRAVGLFWQLLSVTGYLDEHGAYEKIAETLRSAEESQRLQKTFVFWGFQHLNGQQVDLLKALAIRYPVIIPFPLALKEKLRRSDWLSWVKEHRVTEIDLPEIHRVPQAHWVPINSREVSKHLKEILKDGDQIVLGVAKLTSLHLDIVPSTKVSYKIPHELIGVELRALAQLLKDDLSEGCSFGDLQQDLATRKSACLGVRGESTPQFKMLKAIQLYQDGLKLIRELTDEEIKVDIFFLKLLSEVVILNQPRTSYVPMSSHAFTIDFKDMSSLEEVKRDRPVILCVDDRFDEIQSLGQNYTETIQKSLSALGPLKRNELELLFKQWEFLDLFSEARVTVLMSEATLKHSLIWKRLLGGIKLNKELEKKEFQGKFLRDQFKLTVNKPFQGSFSASKFQTFLDCPRKFYYSYVEKIFPSTALKKDFDHLLSGIVIHQIIEIFMKRKLQVEQLGALTREIMNDHITQKSLTLPQDTFSQRELIFNHRALNGINFLKRLCGAAGENVDWNIEQDFSLTGEHKITGKIDCIGTSAKYLFLLDFKSTGSGAASYKEIEDLESLQLWAYAKAAAITQDKFSSRSVILGFVVLDNPAESNLLLSDEDLLKKLKEEKLCKAKVFRSEFTELLKAAEEKMSQLAKSILEEKDFPGVPRKASVCHFCELSKVCVKSELNHV
ncbi:MAG TPA: PD-(D/E)XK nuclease family protein [Bacteriovoracaceae bacterium]|nr:PD-(D/E)XK nuclease family protein [Bacteriovoracaceae bacterium]